MEIAGASEGSARGLRKRTYQFLNSTKSASGISRAFNVFIVTLILLNILAMVLESVQRIHDLLAWWFLAFEQFSVAIERSSA